MRPRVLVVDDDERYLAEIKKLLEHAGYKTSVASSLEDGRRELRSRPPDLLILDVRLGASNGLQLLIPQGQLRIPAIVVTGLCDSTFRADAAAFGASYMIKPVSPAALLTGIKEELAQVDATDRADSHQQLVRANAPSTDHARVLRRRTALRRLDYHRRPV
jgi:DNA-binding response OmpR family regulator